MKFLMNNYQPIACPPDEDPPRPWPPRQTGGLTGCLFGCVLMAVVLAVIVWFLVALIRAMKG